MQIILSVYCKHELKDSLDIQQTRRQRSWMKFAVVVFKLRPRNICVLTMCKCWSIETELAEGQARVAFTSSCVRECISCSTCYIFPTGELRSNLGQQFNKLRSSEMPMVGISHGVYFHY